VLNELKAKKHTATEGLVWLVRFVPLSFQWQLAHTDHPFWQRPGLHRPWHLEEHCRPIGGAVGVVPQRIRRHAQAAPLVPGETDLQRGHERMSIPEGFLREAGRGSGEGRGGAADLVGGAREDSCDPEGVLG
jgi:hypothetical protein